MKRTGKLTVGIVTLALTVLVTAHANNIRVENVSARFQNLKEANTVYVEFDLSWENSWRNELNHDAAWVFVKFRAPDSNHWQHAYLSANTAHHTAPDGKVDLGYSDVNGVTNAVGAFIYSDHNRTGSVTYSRARLLWDYGQSGYSFDEGEVIDISVHAIEMVYVAEGSFNVGTGEDSTGAFTDGLFADTGERIPFPITSEDPIWIGPGEGNLWNHTTHNNHQIGSEGELPAAFPKGFAAFYCMKYTVTQGQYVDFLNLLTYDQQNDRIAGSPDEAPGFFPHDGANRHKVHIEKSGQASDIPAVYATDHPYVACNYLSWFDGVAYMAWAGLRPMTELEYEKACRGPAAPVIEEYAWGTADIASSKYTLADAGTASESIDANYNDSGTHGNANYNSTRPDAPDNGPLRAGIFALETSCRVRSGASYWGIMELSGNLRERAIPVSVYRYFEGAHGAGTITAPADWPSSISGDFNRGGSFAESSDRARVSDRGRASDVSNRSTSDYGCRAVRSAP